MNIKKRIMLSFLAVLCATMPINVFADEALDKKINENYDYRSKLIMPSELANYVKSDANDWVYYGAKFEPRSGIIIGTPVGCNISGIKDGMITYYDWFVPSDEINNVNCKRVEMSERESDHSTIKGINWNFALKDKVIVIDNYKNYIYNYIDKLAAEGNDILLIFGKEFNIDNNFADPELYKECFRFVADYAHTKKNIAMVWPPNDTGGLDTTFDEFYPGDEYVDWIGCSLYSLRYFQGNPESDDPANIAFIMGRYANPSMRAKLIHDFMVRNNIKKPVMITEGGVGYESPDGTDYREWAKHQYRMYLSDIARVYPEFKVFINFNNYVEPGDLYRYDLESDPGLKELYTELTDEPIYLKNYGDTAEYSYVNLKDDSVFENSFDVSTYAYVMGEQDLTVKYFLDGNWLGERTEPPYNLCLDYTIVSYGNHSLKTKMFYGQTESGEIEHTFTLIDPEDNDYTYNDEIAEDNPRFLDLGDSPAEMQNSANFLSDKHITDGIDGLNYAPKQRLTRAELAVLLSRLFNLGVSDTPCGFTDVTTDTWYYKFLNAAKDKNIISGYEDNTFRGGNYITRNEFAKIIAQFLNDSTSETIDYQDDVSDWAIPFIEKAHGSGVMVEHNGDVFSGNTCVTRGDAAVMLRRLYEIIN